MMTSVGVVGLGAMGSSLASRLEACGHEVRTWNRTPPGDTTPADVARASEIVFVLVSDPEALAAVTEGDEGVAAGCDSETTVVQMSTVSPAAVKRLTGALPKGTGLLDAPVHGPGAAVEAGEVAIFAGGDPALVERWRPLLSELGTTVATGPIGSGTAAKLVVNASLFGVLGVLGESVALADRLGLDREVAFDVLATTPLAAAAERRRPAIEAGDYPSRFGLPLALKDAELISEAAGDSDLRLIEAARTWLADAEAEDPDRDYTAILAQILQPPH